MSPSGHERFFGGTTKKARCQGEPDVIGPKAEFDTGLYSTQECLILGGKAEVLAQPSKGPGVSQTRTSGHQ